MEALKFAEIMATMGAVFSPLTDIQLDIYYDCLKEYSLEDLTYAAKKILTTKQFTGKFPSIADFIQMIENRNGSPADRAELAWSKLLWAIENVGHCASVQFDDPTIHSVVQALGGWIRVCSADYDAVYNDSWHTKNLQWRKKDFIRLYQTMAGRSRNTSYLIGLHEAENSWTNVAFVPKLTHVSGEPGQYVAIAQNRPVEITCKTEPQLIELYNKLAM